MKSQTSLVAQQTSLSEWAEQIRECNNRPQGMTVGDWCQSQGITKANYYWRLRKVRESLLEAGDVTPVFVELAAPAAEPVKEQASANVEIAAILKIENHMVLEITNFILSTYNFDEDGKPHEWQISAVSAIITFRKGGSDMAVKYTEEQLNSVDKSFLVALLLNQQEQMESLTRELRETNEKNAEADGTADPFQTGTFWQVF